MKHKVQCEDCKFRLPDEIINGKIDKGALCGFCKKYPNTENSKPSGVINPKFDFLKNPLDEEGFYIDCPEYEKE